MLDWKNLTLILKWTLTSTADPKICCFPVGGIAFVPDCISCPQLTVILKHVPDNGQSFTDTHKHTERERIKPTVECLFSNISDFWPMKCNCKCTQISGVLQAVTVRRRERGTVSNIWLILENDDGDWAGKVSRHWVGGHFYRAVSQKLQRLISNDWYHGIQNNCFIQGFDFVMCSHHSWQFPCQI